MPDIALIGATYPDVPAVDLPLVGGGTARFFYDAIRLPQSSSLNDHLEYDGSSWTATDDMHISGNLVLVIQDDDYDAGIEFTKELNSNLGTILTLRGFADSTEQTSYRPIIRNVSEPVANYDVANKKYVDDHVALPNYHLVFLNSDGTIDTYASTITYATISANLTNPMKSDYLDIIWGNARFYAKCIETIDVQNGDLKFIGEFEYNGMQRYMVFTLTPQNVLVTTNIITFESVSNKTNDIVSNYSSTVLYPSAKAVFDQFQRKPVTVWEVDGTVVTTGLTALETDMSANPSWQLTNLDFSPFKRVKVYTKAARGTGATASASTTPAIILEMSLDPRAAGPSEYGSHYLASTIIQKSNDRNRIATLCCAISADKTSFVVLRMTNLYGTAASNNSDVGGYVFKIEGYYD